jgi:hypothetical protein
MTSKVATAVCCAVFVLAAACDRRPTNAEVPASPALSQSLAQRPLFPQPAIAVSDLPQQESLYDVVTNEFVRQGWSLVCVDVMPSTFSGEAIDPPEGLVASLKARNRSFRPRSACRMDGDDVVDRASGRRDGVAVTLVGADRDSGDFLLRVRWCCWVGWGTLRLTLRDGTWVLRRTEGWLQT